jgi:hypothetical protein
MEKYQITLTGKTPLLLHRDNIDWGARVKKWASLPGNKARSIAGDDRSPAWTWIGYSYFANGVIVIDSDNIMAMLRDAGKKCPAAKGKGSLKAITQSGMIVNEIGWPIVIDSKTVLQKEIESIVDEEDFDIHSQFAKDHGFELFVKRAKIGQSKHIRVRPRFDKWSATGTITVLEKSLEGSLSMIFEQGGGIVGIGDWRPGSGSPGHFGMFDTTIKKL